MKFSKYLLSFCLVITSINHTAAKEPKTIKILPVPAFGYSPETSTYLGAVALFTLDFYNDSITRTSTAKFEINDTWNKQIILESGWSYYFKDETWFTQGRLHYSEYPDYYYGIGPETPQSNELQFDSQRAIIDVSLLKNVGRKSFVGLGLRFQDYWEVEPIDQSIIFPKLKDASLFGTRLIFLKDCRNSLLNATSGSYFLSEYEWVFSQGNYSKMRMDYRKYKTVLKKLVLTGRFYQSVTFGTPPFYDYSILGGDQFVRGYTYGRFRDKDLSSLQFETRIPVVGIVGAALFGGVSNVYSDFGSFHLENFKPNVGLGLRVLVDKSENINLRFDYAIGSGGQNGFYLSFGESF